MGYTTEFYGAVEVQPPLNEKEIEYLKKFADTRRMDRRNGPYFVEGSGFCGQGSDSDIYDYNRPPPGQPGLGANGNRLKMEQKLNGMVQKNSMILLNGCNI